MDLERFLVSIFSVSPNRTVTSLLDQPLVVEISYRAKIPFLIGAGISIEADAVQRSFTSFSKTSAAEQRMMRKR